MYLCCLLTDLSPVRMLNVLRGEVQELSLTLFLFTLFLTLSVANSNNDDRNVKT